MWRWRVLYSLFSHRFAGLRLQVSLRVMGISTPVKRPNRKMIPRNPGSRTHFSSNPDTVLGDPAQIQNAILNLGVNARDAMPSGGLLTFSTRNVELDSEGCRFHAGDIAPGEYLELSVTDTGHGIDPELSGRIFEPRRGHGTGSGRRLRMRSQPWRNRRRGKQHRQGNYFQGPPAAYDRGQGAG